MSATRSAEESSTATVSSLSHQSNPDSSPNTSATPMGSIWRPRDLSDSQREEVRLRNYLLTEAGILDLRRKLEEHEKLAAEPMTRNLRRKSIVKILSLTADVERETARLQSYTARVSKFRGRLPFELLAIVFHFALLEGDGRLHDGYAEAQSTIDRRQDLRLVCSTWNSVIVGSSELWTFRTYRFPIQSSLTTEEWLALSHELNARQKARALHLILLIDQDFTTEYYQDLQLPGMSPSPYQRHPTMEYVLWTPTIELLMRKAESITVEGIALGSGYCTPPMPRNMTALKRLRLRNIRYHVQFYLPDIPNLEEYVVEDSPMALYYPLRPLRTGDIILKELRHFSYRAAGGERRESDGPFVFLRDVALPALQSIVLAVGMGNSQFQVPASSLRGVRRLELGPMWDCSFIAIVAAMSALDELVLDGFIRKVDDGKVSKLLFIGHFLERLSGPGVSGEPPLAPNLKILDLKACAFTRTNLINLTEGWQSDGVLDSKHIMFHDCMLTGRRNKGKKAFVEEMWRYYGVFWPWDSTERFTEANTAYVTVDAADSSAETDDTAVIEAEGEGSR